ncbi:MAG: hypothetical protein ACREUF_03440, partial [Solimonas sp.]
MLAVRFFLSKPLNCALTGTSWRRNGMGRMGRRFSVAALAACLTLGAFAAVGSGEETLTRPDYVAGLEQICKPRAEATRRAMDGVRDDVHANRLTLASRKFGRAATIFGGTVATIAGEPRPAADAVKLKEWFGYLKKQQSYLVKITKELRMEHEIKAQRLTARFIHNGNLANNVVLAFG